MTEENRIGVTDLSDLPFISNEFINFPLTDIDKDGFVEAQGRRDLFSDFDSENGSAMLSRFDDTEIVESDVILTTRRSY